LKTLMSLYPRARSLCIRVSGPRSLLPSRYDEYSMRTFSKSARAGSSRSSNSAPFTSRSRSVGEAIRNSLRIVERLRLLVFFAGAQRPLPTRGG